MLCLVILQRTNGNYDKIKNVYKIYQINSHMRWKKVQQKQKSKPITATLESAIILQYSFKNEVEETKRFQNESYGQSPEYNDLQLVLNQFAKSRTNVIFVIPPVMPNGWNTQAWAQKVWAGCSKIRYQLESQDSPILQTFSKMVIKPYFLWKNTFIWDGMVI